MVSMYSRPAVDCDASGSLHCLIPEGYKVPVFKMFNLRVEIVAERLSRTWSGVLMCTQKCGNHRPHLLELI